MPVVLYVNKCKHFMSSKGEFYSILKLTTAHNADFNQINFNQLYVKKNTYRNNAALKIIL